MRRALPYLMLAGAALFWAGNLTTGRALRDVWSPVPLNTARWVIALAVLAPFTWREVRAQARTLGRHALWLVALALSGVVAFQVFAYQALHTTPVVTAALLGATTPIAIALGGWLAFGDRPTRSQVAGLGVSLVGALVVVARGDLTALWGLRLAPGDLWMVAAVLCWAVYSLLLKRTPPGVTQGALVTASAATGLLLQAPLLAWRLSAGDAFPTTATAWAGAAYIGLFAGALAFVFWNRGVAAIGATRAGVFLHLMPVFAATLGVTLLGEALGWYHVVGGALVLAGLTWSSRVRRPSH